MRANVLPAQFRMNHPDSLDTLEPLEEAFCHRLVVAIAGLIRIELTIQSVHYRSWLISCATILSRRSQWGLFSM